jgi:hypothetical protein
MITVRTGAAPWSGPITARAASVTSAAGTTTIGTIVTGIIATISELTNDRNESGAWETLDFHV